jgi:hypothetical protein
MTGNWKVVKSMRASGCSRSRVAFILRAANILFPALSLPV